MTQSFFSQDCYADPITKQPLDSSDSRLSSSIPDFRVFLKNTHGYAEWLSGQEHFEALEQNSLVNLGSDYYRDEFSRDAKIYHHFNLQGAILDVGCGSATLRGHLSCSASQYIGCDVFDTTRLNHSASQSEIYPCLSDSFQFCLACAEFLPFHSSLFDVVHMRSMLDHVQVPDLVLLEAKRVCKDTGYIIIGLLLEPSHGDKNYLGFHLKEFLKDLLSHVNHSLKDYHMFHPTLPHLVKLTRDCGLIIVDTQYQQIWSNQSIYLKLKKNHV